LILPLTDLEPKLSDLKADTLKGLLDQPKYLLAKYFYDQTGSKLFNKICEQKEYYITRTEIKLLQTHAKDMVHLMGKNCLLIEFGSGNSNKIKPLLKELGPSSGYVPIDISKAQLMSSAIELSKDFPWIKISPICADYTHLSTLPLKDLPKERVVFFPGSTIGNLNPYPMKQLLEGIATLVGKGGGFLVGLDLKKDKKILEQAYNDANGITAEFNVNILRRLNQELGTNFNVLAFKHRAFYNKQKSRIEMHLISQKEQVIKLEGQTIQIQKGESIHTENSYKYNSEEFSQAALGAGFKKVQEWTDPQKYFSILFLKQL